MIARLFAFLLLVAAAHAAVDGVVVNGTTGTPAANISVTLFKFGEGGMEPMDTVKTDAAGKFAFSLSQGKGPHMLQMILEDVSYTQMIQPGTPSTNLQLEVFSASKKPGDAKVSQHMVLFEPSADQLAVSETFFYRNEGKTTYNDPAAGTLRVFLPDAADGKVKVTALAPGSVAVERVAEKTAKNTYKIDFPIKPGETRIDLSYQIPFTNPGKFVGKTLVEGAVTRLVAPDGVTLKGEGFEPLGAEPKSKAAIFGVKGSTYTVEISGSGAIRQPAAAAPAGGPDESEGPSVQRILPRVYDQLYPILGIALAALAIGFILLYRKTAK